MRSLISLVQLNIVPESTAQDREVKVSRTGSLDYCSSERVVVLVLVSTRCTSQESSEDSRKLTNKFYEN